MDESAPHEVEGGVFIAVLAEALGPSIYEVFHEFTAAIARSIVERRVALSVLHSHQPQCTADAHALLLADSLLTA